MRSRTLIALAVIAGFAATAQAGGDKTTGASAKPGSTSASAGASASDPGKMFQSLDKNHDGFLTRAEVKDSPQDKNFSALDKNRDGKLSRDEYAAAAGSSAASGGSKPKSKY